ncbi:hypothetical protein EVAR_62038_1 [Eumeta japonica]|uniref:Uncharacterized protein n=1 Tax=Eumeta variegata TaxID=151549 RepID=A0A4C1YRW3_EUMVA|nr:hypothetical protein EVAR_62038_1 [Eumeta japonica]
MKRISKKLKSDILRPSTKKNEISTRTIDTLISGSNFLDRHLAATLVRLFNPRSPGRDRIKLRLGWKIRTDNICCDWIADDPPRARPAYAPIAVSECTQLETSELKVSSGKECFRILKIFKC